MVSKRLSIFGYISAAALVSGVLAGCGGSSSSVEGVSPVVQTTGGIPNAPGNTATTVPASATTPQQVQVTSGGTTVTGTVPPGQPTITPSTVVNVTPANKPIIKGLTDSPSNHQARSLHPLQISYDGGANYINTGVNVDGSGAIDGDLILTAGSIYLRVSGPFTIVSGTFPNIHQLTVQNFVFGIVIDASGVSSIPADLTMRIPSNGGTTTSGNYVNVTYPTPNFSTGSATLVLTWPGVTKIQSKTVVGGLCAYSDPLSDSSDAIPASGVTTVKFTYVK